MQAVVCHSCFWWGVSSNEDGTATYELAEEDVTMPEDAWGRCPKCGEWVYLDGPAPEEDRAKWYEQYKEEFESWNWGWMKNEAERDMAVDLDNPDMLVGMVFIGSLTSVTPSGKFYTPFAHSNITEYEANRDEAWHSALEAVAEKHDMAVMYNDGDVFVGVWKDNEALDEDEKAISGDVITKNCGDIIR